MQRFDELTPDQKILLALIDAGAKREALGVLSWKARTEGYQSRPDDAPIAAKRYAETMPTCFDSEGEELSAFQAWKRKGVHHGLQ